MLVFANIICSCKSRLIRDKVRVEPGQLAVQYDYLAKTDQIIISIAYNGNATKAK